MKNVQKLGLKFTPISDQYLGCTPDGYAVACVAGKHWSEIGLIYLLFWGYFSHTLSQYIAEKINCPKFYEISQATTSVFMRFS